MSHWMNRIYLYAPNRHLVTACKQTDRLLHQMSGQMTSADVTVENNSGEPQNAEPPQNRKKSKKNDDELHPVSLLDLFKFSSHTSKILVSIGVALSVISGACSPFVNFLIALVVNTLVCYGRYMRQGNYVASNGTSPVYISNYTSQWAVKDLLSCTVMSNNLLHNNILVLSITIAAVACIQATIGYLQTVCFGIAAKSQAIRIRCLFLKSVLRQDIAWFDNERYGEFIYGSIDNMQKYKDAISDSLGPVFVAVSSAIVSIVLSLYFGWELTLASISPYMLATVSITFGVKYHVMRTPVEVGSLKCASNIAREAITALKTVIAFGGEQKELARYNAQLDIARTACIRRKLIAAMFSTSTQLILFSSFALTFWYGLLLIAADIGSPHPRYEPFVVILIFFCISQTSMQLGLIPKGFQAVAEAKMGLAFVFQVIDRVPHIDSYSEKGLVFENMKGMVEFQSVHFNYPSRPDIKVLDGLSLKINSGETLAIVGESGCGKSTVGSLIQRFYDPLEGQVAIDGINITALNLGWVRKHISVVGQEPILFSKTIAENIRFGNSWATQEVIEKAAKDAFAHTFINSLPNKYETVLGERESQLSGGQKQRIAIARALVGNPKILILDEPTSALDYASEMTVMQAIKKAAVGRTTIIITHRLSMLQDSTQICVISNGKITEYGNSQQLLKNEGTYYQLFNSQKPDILPSKSNRNMDDALSNCSLASKSTFPSRSSSCMLSTRSSYHGSPNVDNEFHGKAKGMPEKGELTTVETSTILQLCKLCLPEWYCIIPGFIFNALLGAAPPTVAWTMGQSFVAMADINKETFERNASHIGLLFVALAISFGFATFITHRAITISGENVVQRLKFKSFRSILQQDMAWFEDTLNGPGKIYSQLEYDIAIASSAVWTTTQTLLTSLSSMCSCIIFALITNWKLGLVFAALFPLLISISSIQKKLLREVSVLDSKVLIHANKIAMEAIANIRTVVSFHSEKAILDDYEDEMRRYSRSHIWTMHVNGILIGLSKGLIWTGISVIVYFGHILVLQNDLQFQQLLIILRLLLTLEEPIKNLSTVIPIIDKSFIALQRTFQLIDRKPVIDSGDDNHKIQPLNDNSVAAELKHVNFYYPSRKEVTVLDGISLKVPAKNIVGLVGSSGCGKSTVLQLLLRFYDPQKGIVSVAGQDVKKLNASDLRASISIVSQEPVLFDRSIQENIAYGDNTRDIPFDEIVSAARLANIHNFISQLPEGYNTKVGDKGTFLSGGQKQRIAIARALVRNPKILLLDEATSALDAENEKVVQEALDVAQVGRTSIIITHRLSTIAHADIIFVMHNGKVVEIGKHSELLKRQGHYSTIYNAQIINKD